MKNSFLKTFLIATSILIIISGLTFLIDNWYDKTDKQEQIIQNQINNLTQSTTNLSFFLINSLRTGGRNSLTQAVNSSQTDKEKLLQSSENLNSKIQELPHSTTKNLLIKRNSYTHLALSYISSAMDKTKALQEDRSVSPIYDDLYKATQILEQPIDNPENKSNNKDIKVIKSKSQLELDSQKIKAFRIK
jgi:hypothetical protein